MADSEDDGGDDERPSMDDLREATADTDGDDGDDDEMADDASKLSKTFRGARKRLSERRSRKGAKKLKRKRQRRQRRNSVKEKAGVEEAQLLASELGVTGERAKEIASEGMDLIEQAASAGGDALAQLDIDGDGDTDILDAIENEPIEGTADQPFGGRDAAMGPRQSGNTDGTGRSEPPVGDVEDDFDDLQLGGIEEDLGIDEPIEEQQDGGLF
jgi:hypothetical protein